MQIVERRPHVHEVGVTVSPNHLMARAQQLLSTKNGPSGPGVPTIHGFEMVCCSAVLICFVIFRAATCRELRGKHKEKTESLDPIILPGLCFTFHEPGKDRGSAGWTRKNPLETKHPTG